MKIIRARIIVEREYQMSRATNNQHTIKNDVRIVHEHIYVTIKHANERVQRKRQIIKNVMS